MAIAFLAWELMILQERVRQMERRIVRRVLQDAQNPFDLPRNKFMNIFCISPDLALEITDLIRPDLIRQRSTGISSEIEMLIAVQFYAHGSYQRPTGDQFNFNVQFPMTWEERQVVRAKFANAPQPFEGTIDWSN